MDSLELLAREDEFKKLNKQLEKKTESLMKEIEHAMQKRDIFSEFSPCLTLSPIHTRKKHNCENKQETPQLTPQKEQKHKNRLKNTTLHKNVTKFENRNTDSDVSNSKLEKIENGGSFDSAEDYVSDKCKDENVVRICDYCINRSHIEDKEFLYAFVSVNVKDKVLPESFLKDTPTVEIVCKFLSSKVKLIQEQIDKLQNTLNKKASQCESHLTQLAGLESERMTLLNKCNNMKASTADMKAKYMAVQLRLEEKEKLYIEQRSLSDKLSCEVKQYRTKTSALEAKCATQQHSIEQLNQQLEGVRKTEKEYRETTRSLSASHQGAISRLEAQVKAQASRLDKQMALIDNLRRQNVLLSTEAAVKALEKEYCDYLEKDF